MKMVQTSSEVRIIEEFTAYIEKYAYASPRLSGTSEAKPRSQNPRPKKDKAKKTSK